MLLVYEVFARATAAHLIEFNNDHRCCYTNIESLLTGLAYRVPKIYFAVTKWTAICDVIVIILSCLRRVLYKYFRCKLSVFSSFFNWYIGMCFQFCKGLRAMIEISCLQCSHCNNNMNFPT